MSEDKLLYFLGSTLSKLYLLKEQEEVLKEILIFISNISGSIKSSLLMLKNNPKKILYEYSKPDRKFTIRKSDIKLDSKTITDVLSKGEIVNTKEISEMFLIPLKFLNDIQGIIFVQKKSFKKTEIKRLIELAPIIAFLVLNSRLYNYMDSLIKELRISYEISTALIEEINLDRIIERIFTEIRSHFGFEIIGLFLLDEEKNLTLEYTVEENRPFKGLKIKYGEGITGYAVKTGEPYYAPDVRKVPFYIEGIKSVLSEFAIPLKFKDRIIGVLDINSKKLDDFPDSTRKLLVSLAAIIAVSLENARLFEKTELLSKMDMLTGVLNRRSIELEIEKFLKKCKEENKNLTIFFLDLDHFKEFNDRFGHQKGDEVLRLFCDTMRKRLKEEVCGRYGGDEFICVFFDKEVEYILSLGRLLLKDTAYSKKLKGITLSIGVSYYPDDGDTTDELIRIADKRCYDAKKLGGNRINF